MISGKNSDAFGAARAMVELIRLYLKLFQVSVFFLFVLDSFFVFNFSLLSGTF